MRRISSCLAIVALLAVSACSKGAEEVATRNVTNDIACAQPQEADALTARALQSDMMNSALSCNQQELYNTFVEHFKPQLTHQHALVEGYFDRLYRERASRQMTTFMTGLANLASEQSFSMDGVQFCQQSAHKFQQLMQVRDISEYTAQADYGSMHGISTCGSERI